MLFHELLSLFGLLPPFLGTFIAPHMDVLRREHIAQLREHIGQEGEHLRFGSQHVVELVVDPPGLGRLVLQVRLGAEFGMHGQYRHAMARDVDLGDNGDIAFGGIFHDLLGLLLGIVASIGAFAVRAGIQPEDFPFAGRALGGEFRVGLHL